jgi:hypothetical protein
MDVSFSESLLGSSDQSPGAFNILRTHCRSWQAQRTCEAPQDPYTSVSAVVDIGPPALRQRSMGMTILLPARSPDLTLAEILPSITTLVCV